MRIVRWSVRDDNTRADFMVDLQKLQLWEPLQSLLTSDNASPEIKTAVLWIIGTALQNNPAAQDDVRIFFITLFPVVDIENV